MNDKDEMTDKELDDYLAGKSPLSKIYSSGNGLDSPVHLDRSIRQMAQQAQGRHSKGSTQPAKSRWYIPLSIAAAILIAVLVTVLSSDFSATDEKVLGVKQTDPETTQITSEQSQITKETAKINTEASQQSEKPNTDKTKNIPSQHKSDKNDSSQMATTDIQKEEKPVNVADNKTDHTAIPENLQEILQPVSAGGSDELLPAEVLKIWTRQQWREHVAELQKNGQMLQAKKYVDEYPKYFPGESLTVK